MGWTTGVQLPAGAGKGFFYLCHCIQTGSGVHPAFCTMGTMALSPKVQQQVPEVDHSPPSSVKVKNAWGYSLAPPYIFMGWCLIKHKDNFTFSCQVILIGNSRMRHASDQFIP